MSESNSNISSLPGYGVNFGASEARLALAIKAGSSADSSATLSALNRISNVVAPATGQGAIPQTNYSMPVIVATIPTGSRNSNTFYITFADKIHIFAPLTLSSAASLQVSIDDGNTWRPPLNIPIEINAGQTLNASDMAVCSGLFRSDVAWRVTLDFTATANRDFTIFGVK